VSACWGLQRATDRVRERILQLFDASELDIRHADQRMFLWPKAVASESLNTFRVPGSSQSARMAEDICPEEVAVVIRELLAKHFSLGLDDLLREVARQFGILRLGGNVREFLAEGLSLASEAGTVTVEDDVVKMANPPLRQE